MTEAKYVVIFYHLDRVDAVRTRRKKQEAWDLAQGWIDEDNDADGSVEIWGVGMGMVASSEGGDFS